MPSNEFAFVDMFADEHGSLKRVTGPLVSEFLPFEQDLEWWKLFHLLHLTHARNGGILLTRSHAKNENELESAKGDKQGRLRQVTITHSEAITLSWQDSPNPESSGRLRLNFIGWHVKVYLGERIAVLTRIIEDGKPSRWHMNTLIFTFDFPGEL